MTGKQCAGTESKRLWVLVCWRRYPVPSVSWVGTTLDVWQGPLANVLAEDGCQKVAKAAKPAMRALATPATLSWAGMHPR